MMWKVLLVDDNQSNLDLLVDVLEGRAQCTVCASGEEALVAYNASVSSEENYDIILLDIAMPGLDGIDVLKAIRSKEKGRGVREGEGIPIIMVTAYKEPFMVAFNKGCDDYILKPIDPDGLIAKIQEKLS